MIQLAILAFDASLLVALLPAWAWSTICISRTHEDRIDAITSRLHRPVTWQQLAHAFQAVTFRQHLRARLLGRDPWVLYDPMVLDAIKNPRTEVIAMMPGGQSDPPPAVH